MKAVSIALAAVMIATGLLASLPAHAQQESTPMTDEHIARIKNNCQSAIATLSQIHANDGPVFVNRNQAYFSISDKLIARLNSRLALNRFDTTPLAKIASEYNAALARFKTEYKKYDDAMGDLVKMNCSRQPVGFYDKTNEVRQLRENVHAAIARLHSEIDQYRQAVAAFEIQHAARLKGGSND